MNKSLSQTRHSRKTAVLGEEMNLSVHMTTPSVRQLLDNLPVRHVQWVKKMPGDQLGEVSLGFTTRRPVTDDNPSTAVTETINRSRLTLKTPVKPQTAPSSSTCT